MMKNRLSFIRTGCLAFVAALALISCDLDSEAPEPGPVSYVTVYNASPDSPELGIVVDNRPVNTYPLEYGEYTGYMPFYTGNRNLKFGPFGASNTVVDTTVTLVDQNVYSVFVVDEYQNAEVLILNDSADEPAAGKAM